MCINPSQTFGTTSKELFAIIRERYPEGLHAEVGAEEDSDGGLTPPLCAPPEDQEDDYIVDYALPKNVLDLHEGWNELNVADGKAVISSCVPDAKNGYSIAFSIRRADAPKAGFRVKPAQMDMDDNDETLME